MITLVMRTEENEIKRVNLPVPEEIVPHFRDGVEFEPYDELIEIETEECIQDIIWDIETVKEINEFARDVQEVGKDILLRLRKETYNVWELWSKIKEQIERKD